MIPIDPQDPGSQEEVIIETITDNDLGQMFFIDNTVLVSRSSGEILFFKREVDEKTNKVSWNNFYTLELKGSIFFMKGNDRL